jgi:hypothetical protein
MSDYEVTLVNGNSMDRNNRHCNLGLRLGICGELQFRMLT